MAQKAIREYDAKVLRSNYAQEPYHWILIENHDDYEDLLHTLEEYEQKFGHTQWVIKPDQLFGKRWKYWLVWVWLEKKWVLSWLDTYREKRFEINQTIWILNTFLVEPFIPHKEERYCSFSTHAKWVQIIINHAWWVDVEKNWDKRVEYIHPIDMSIDQSILAKKLQCDNYPLVSRIVWLYDFFIKLDIAFLEINPLVEVSSWKFVFLDMVVRLDVCAAYKHRDDRAHIERTEWFGSVTDSFEKTICAVDAKTWSSLKYSLLNPNGSIALLLWWWWASILTIDTLTDAWYGDEIMNYWELSWNPSYDDNYVYISWLLNELCASNAPHKILCILWWIANFTNIKALLSACVAVLQKQSSFLKKHNISLFVRRWWIDDKEWLALFETFCTQNWLRYFVADGDYPLVDAIRLIPEYLWT